MKKIIVFISLCLTCQIYGQKTYKFPVNFNPYYDFKPEEAYQKLLRDPALAENKSQLQSFTVQYIFNEQFTFDNNSVYMDWGETEVYMLKILNKVLPKETRRKNLDLFLRRSPVSNAGTSRFGNVFFNIGMFCDAENEAFLAGVIAHEAGHYLFNHGVKKVEEYGVLSDIRHMQADDAKDFMRMNRAMEQQADSFALACLVNAGINIEPLLQYHESNDAMDMALQYSRSYKNMVKASSLSAEGLKERRRKVYNPYASHPSAIERYDYVKKVMDNTPNKGADFFVDSLFFLKLRKMAREERKKISMESCDYNRCMSYSFVDYMYDPKNLKNIYYLIESIRRILYIKPGLGNRGFLTETVNDDDLFYQNKSVLHKPEFLFNSYKEFDDLKDHPFIKEKIKPFETYKEALLYLSSEAIKLGFNEAHFTVALYYQSIYKVELAKKFMTTYINNGNGLYIEYAGLLLKNEKPFAQKGKTLMVYNNIANYTKFNFNYYLSIKRRSYNSDIKEKFGRDSSRVKLVIVNELLGKAPNQLNETHKLMQSVFSLYDDNDIEACKKVRLTSHFAGENDEISAINKKQLLIYAPEWYSWMKERNYSNLFIVDVIYQYSKHMEQEESFNNYTGYYLDFNQDRPYFKDAARNGFNLKQKEKEIHSALYSFLYE